MEVCSSCGKAKKPKHIIDPVAAMKLMLEGVDPYNDPEKPIKMLVSDAEKAMSRIKKYVTPLPLTKSHLSDVCGMEIYLKEECFHKTGSCKERSSRNALLALTPEQKKHGVCCSTTGNFGVAISLHGKEMGLKIVIFAPVHTPDPCVHKMKKFGAEVIIEGEDIVQATELGLKYAAKNGMFFLRGHIELMAGLSTIALEILNDLPDADVVVLPIGSGSLIAGCAKVLKAKKPGIKVYGVESDMCPAFFTSKKHGVLTNISKNASTVAENVVFSSISPNAFATGKDLIDKIIVLNDEYITIAMLRLVELDKIVTEGAGAMSVAAILSNNMEEFKGKKVVCVVSGGNIQTSLLCRAIDRGIAAEGRYIKIKCWLVTRVGAAQEFCKVCEEHGADIKYVIPETTWLASDVFHQSLKLIVFMKNYEESMALKKTLEEKYGDDVCFNYFRVQEPPLALF